MPLSPLILSITEAEAQESLAPQRQKPNTSTPRNKAYNSVQHIFTVNDKLESERNLIGHISFLHVLYFLYLLLNTPLTNGNDNKSIGRHVELL